MFFIAVCQYIDMVCLQCRSNTQVINSRLKHRSNKVWRRRQCIACNSTFTTEEACVYALSLAIKNDEGLIQPFSSDELFLELYKACAHRKTALKDARALADTVTNLLIKESTGSVINSGNIKTACLIVLNRFDKVAFSQYQAYHP